MTRPRIPEPIRRTFLRLETRDVYTDLYSLVKDLLELRKASSLFCLISGNGMEQNNFLENNVMKDTHNIFELMH